MSSIERFNERALTGSMFDFSKPSGPDLLQRIGAFEDWRMNRSNAGVWPFSRFLHDAPGANMEIVDEGGRGGKGVSLSCQDYLGLTSHPAIHEAAKKALMEFGPHSAGSPALAGNTPISQELETALGEALQADHVALFPTGWGAGYGTITGLVRAGDHIVMDQLAHACLQQGVLASTRNVHRFPHLDNHAVRKILKEIRAEDSKNGILVITEGLFSMDSDVPAIGDLQNICHEFGATLMVDVAHDFGSLGENGGGSLEVQNLLGKVDLVMGSFSKTFASNGGFLAARSESVRQYIKFYSSPQTFSNALSPVQSAVVLQALRIVRSEEGKRLREDLLRNVNCLRGALEAEGIRCIGGPSAIVPAYIGDEAVARIAWSQLAEKGIHANLVEFPAVAVGSARFRMQLMPSHDPERLESVAKATASVIAEAAEVVKSLPPLPKRTRKRIDIDPSMVALGVKALTALKPGDINKLFKSADTKVLPPETVLIEEGRPVKALYLIRKGQARVEVRHLDTPVVIAECGEGDVLGEVSFLDGKGATASVVADTEIEAISLDQESIVRLVKEEPELGMRLYQSLATILAKRLRSCNPQVLPAASLS